MKLNVVLHSKVFDHQSKNDICKDVDENFSDQN